MLRVMPLFPLALISLALSACSGRSQAEAVSTAAGGSRPLSITSALTYRQRIGLPADARGVVELAAVAGSDTSIIAETRVNPAGRQVPIPFELTVRRDRLVAGARHLLRGAVVIGSRPSWVTEPMVIDPDADSVELGELFMTPYQATAFTTRIRCGDRAVSAGFGGDTLRLTVDQETFEMRQTPAASGARYEAVDDSSTVFWSKGDSATLSVRGRRLPPCDTASGDMQTFKATGNEPGWQLEIGEAGTVLVTDYGAERIAAPTPSAETRGSTTVYRVRAEGHDVTITIDGRPCADAMSGMPFPSTVTVLLDGRTLHGCGGDPASTLQGSWVVEQIGGEPLIENSQVTLDFNQVGRLGGLASCNSYSAAYTLTGEMLTIGRAVRTLKACAPALMRQEDRFLDLLEAVQRFELADQSLVLHTGDGRSITARSGS